MDGKRAGKAGSYVGASIQVGVGLTMDHCSDVFTLPSVVAGMEYPRPIGIMAQELCRHLQLCLKHENVARQLTLRELNLAYKQWACGSLHELQEEMHLWKWDLMLNNRWSRVEKCMQLLNIPVELAEDAHEDNEQRGTSWASATRELRRPRHRIEEVGGSKDQWGAGVCHMDKEQWNELWTGEQAFWQAVAAGHGTMEGLTEPRKRAMGNHIRSRG